MKYIISIFICVFVLAVFCNAAPAEHLISVLPGLLNASSVNFTQYAGYVTVDESHKRKLFYWFVQSQRNPAQDPLVLWLNGGPGSSSLIGFLTEHGPFRVRSDKNIEPHKQSWNRIANILYLETPAGVGFSNSQDSSDYKTNDKKTAEDNYVFLQKWFELFPEFKKNDLYLSGESYAGHYIPTLAREILEKDTTKSINVRGILLGNPVTNQDLFMPFNPSQDLWAYMGFLFYHGLISHGAYEQAFKECNLGEGISDCSINYSSKSDACWDAIYNGINEMPDNIDVYDIDAEICVDGAVQRLQHTSKWSWISRMAIKKLKDHPKVKKMPKIEYEQDNRVDPCLENYLPLYLNREDVQKALHADKTVWKSLSTILDYETIDDNMLPIYQDFMKNDRAATWRILIYSGDFDVVVPLLSTQRWVRCLGRPITKPWHYWMIGSQVGGNVIEYDRISYLTIKGAGHMVPYYTPDKGYAFFQTWIENKPFY